MLVLMSKTLVSTKDCFKAIEKISVLEKVGISRYYGICCIDQVFFFSFAFLNFSLNLYNNPF